MPKTLTKPTVIRPVLKWPGNKFGTKIAKRVEELLAPFLDTHLYVEPFVGAGGMAYYLKPKQALLSDADAVIIGLHRWLKDGDCEGVYPSGVGEDHYYQQRLLHRGSVVELESSPDFIDGDARKRNEFFSRLIWLSRNTYNGLYRQNSKGEYNSPYGNRDVTPNIDFSELSKLYSGWLLSRGDFQSLESCQVFRSPGKILYIDPPYHGTYTGYTGQGFTWNDQKRLAHWLVSLNCPVVASNADHPDIRFLYSDLGFTIEEIKVRRCIAPKGEQRGVVKELLMHRGCV